MTVRNGRQTVTGKVGRYHISLSDTLYMNEKMIMKERRMGGVEEGRGGALFS